MIVFGLADQHGEDAVLGPLLVDEVVAEDFVLRLELAVDAAVALLHAAGVPRHVEVEQVPAVGLKIETLAGGVGGDEDAHGVLAGRLLNARLISSRSSGGVGPW